MMSTDWECALEAYCRSDGRADLTCRDLVVDLESFFAQFAEDYNRTISSEPLMITVRKIAAPDRLMISTLLWTISARSTSLTAEWFLVPAAEVSTLMEAEVPSRCKLKLVLEEGGLVVDGTPVTSRELVILLRSLLRDLISRSEGDYDRLPDSVRLLYGTQSLTGSVRSLVAEKNVLVQKIVNQQEDILAGVARELHDTVLGNLMLLERSFSGGKRMTDADVLVLVKDAVLEIRELCHDLYPRDLKDCGLAVMLQELCTKLHERLECETTFVSHGELPPLSDEVQLHIYRIAQECCNNIARHSDARTVSISISYDEDKLVLNITDDGKGFANESQCARRRSGGFGSTIIRERAELIDYIMPATLLVDSRPGFGTTVSLTIKVQSASD